jgi:hypothetical protein
MNSGLGWARLCVASAMAFRPATAYLKLPGCGSAFLVTSYVLITDTSVWWRFVNIFRCSGAASTERLLMPSRAGPAVESADGGVARNGDILTRR